MYHRILIDYCLRTVPRQITDTALFDLANPHSKDAGAHEFTRMEQETIQSCISTIDAKYMESCVPGLFDTLLALNNSNLPLNAITLRTVEGSCLDVAFTECTYKARLLLKKMLYDFARIHLNLGLSSAPHGSTGEMGPPVSSIEKCISSTMPEEAENCVPGLIYSLHKIFIEKVEQPEPIVEQSDIKTAMKCLTKVFRYCDLPTKMFILKEIAAMSDVTANIEIETHIKMDGTGLKNPSIAKRSAEAGRKVPNDLRKPMDNSVASYVKSPAEIAVHFAQQKSSFDSSNVPYDNSIIRYSFIDKDHLRNNKIMALPLQGFNYMAQKEKRSRK